jgi:predicted NodU family carbamoyl transferase
MKHGMTLFGGAVVIAAASFALGAETQKSLVATYDSLADTILGAKKSERNLVLAIVGSHHAHAQSAFKAGKFDDAAAEMALFANEGDNAVGGIRKRLVEGGHHHNAEGEEKGVYEAGFVIVTKAAKQKAMAASAALIAAKAEGDRKAAWDSFESAAGPLLEGK